MIGGSHRGVVGCGRPGPHSEAVEDVGGHVDGMGYLRGVRGGQRREGEKRWESGGTVGKGQLQDWEVGGGSGKGEAGGGSGKREAGGGRREVGGGRLEVGGGGGRRKL
jgi:hypothetical protein